MYQPAIDARVVLHNNERLRWYVGDYHGEPHHDADGDGHDPGHHLHLAITRHPHLTVLPNVQVPGKLSNHRPVLKCYLIRYSSASRDAWSVSQVVHFAREVKLPEGISTIRGIRGNLLGRYSIYFEGDVKCDKKQSLCPCKLVFS